MLKHRWTDRVCLIVLAAALLLTGMLMGVQPSAGAAGGRVMGYENRLFDQSKVHEIEILMDDWEGFLETCTDEQYVPCTVIIDGEKYADVGIRAKGNTSLSSVKSYGNNRYSFKVEFDQYSPGGSYHGLDKLSLNNVIQDNTYMKDYMTYTMMNKMGVAAPLCSFARISVNGEAWGLYLAAEAVEDSFLRRNFGNDAGELYKPDSMSFGGGRGNGRDFNMDDFAEKFSEAMESGEMQLPEGVTEEEAQRFARRMENFDPTQPDGFDPAQPGGMTPPEGFDPAQPGGMTPPEGFDPSQMGGMVPPEMPGGNAGAEAGERDFSMNRPGDFGGGRGGMGSDDVRLVYTDDDPDSYSNIFGNAKTDVSEADQARLIAALKAMNEGDTSAVDTDAVIRYLAVHNFVCNGDSYTGNMVHNYYLYEKDGVLSMIPWDYNLAMGAFNMGGGFGMSGATGTVNSPIDSPVSDGDVSSRPMVAWIFDSEETVSQYHAVYDELIATLFESGWYEQTVTEVSEMIAPYVEADPTKFCTCEQFTAGVEALKQFGALRARSVRGQLEGEIPSTSEGQQQDSSALVDGSGLNLSDMGSMGNMGGNRGGDMEKRGFARGMQPDTPVDPEETAGQGETAEPEEASPPETTAEPQAPAMGGMAPPDLENTPPMGGMPGDMTPPGMGEMPEGMTPPDLENMPPMGGMPGGMTPPGMGEMPEGMTPPDLENMPPMGGMPPQAP